MASDQLQQFFGTNPQRQQEYTDFIQRYQDDPGSISDAEAARRYREMMRNAPPDLAEEAHDQAFGQLSQEDRGALADRFRDATQDPNRPYDGYHYDDPQQATNPRDLGRMARKAEDEDPDLLDQILGQDSPLNSTLGRAALAGAAAYLASRVLSNQGQGQGGGLGGLFGGQPQQNEVPGLKTRQSGGLDKQV